MALALFGVASEGRATHWDGSLPPDAVLLRWMLNDGVLPPPHGYQLSTSEVTPAVIDDFAGAKGRTVHHMGIVTLGSETPMAVSGASIFIAADQLLVITLTAPAGAVTVHSASRPNEILRVAASLRGRNPDERTVAPDDSVTFHARAIDTITVQGPGSVDRLLVTHLDGPFQWTPIASLSLPVAHPNHPARRNGDADSDAALAHSRLPAGVWDSPPIGFDATTAHPQDPTTYEQVFAQLHPVLVELFDGVSDEFPPASADPRIELDRWQTIQLACLDPHVARMLGFAHDHTPATGLGTGMAAYRVRGGWNRGQLGPGAAREAIIADLPHRDPGPPPAPEDLTARITQPSRRPIVGLRWTAPSNTSNPFAPVLRYQPFARHLNADGAPAATPPTPSPEDRLVHAPLLVPAHVLADELPFPFIEQRKVEDGRWAWWARSVDVFGRVSEPISTQDVVWDTAAPPPPHLVHAAWLQRDLPGQAPASPAAHRWRVGQPQNDALVVRWAWTPELHERAPDVEEFRVVVRRPMRTGPDTIDWAGAAWEPPVHVERPDTVIVPVNVTSIGDRVDVDLRRVTPIDPGSVLVEVDLDLEDGAARLTDATLNAGGAALRILSATYSRPTVLRVALDGQHAPATGPGTLTGAGLVQATVTPAGPLGASPGSRTAGLIVVGDMRLARLGGLADDRVLGLLLQGAATGGIGTWFPAWEVAIQDRVFGPRPDPSTPVAALEVGVVAVRPLALNGSERRSTPAGPAMVHAVDTTPPPTPQLDSIPGGTRCAMIATAADFHGHSYVNLSWPTQRNIRYRVHRALWASVERADREAAASGQREEVPDRDLPNDTNRRRSARQQLDSLSQSHAGPDAADLDAAYASLGLDARAALASRPHVRAAYSVLDPEPVAASAVPYEDRFDGRAGGHWVYRVEPVSAAGVAGAWSQATPPICAPDVVAPPAPQVQQILSAPGAVRLRWVRSPAADLDHWVIYRSREPEVTDVRDLEQVAKLTASTDGPATVDRTVPAAVTANNAWLEHEVPARPGVQWTYRLTAVDESGNASVVSLPLRGAALAEPPSAPIWNEPSRQPDGTVALSWTAQDDRLVCMVERRGATGGRWQTVGGWLPRGRYQAVDLPPDPAASWDYRLRVTSVHGLPAAQRPVVTLAREI